MSDLDDFFKKRDKKKKTAKAKFSTLDITDEFAKQIEITSIRSSELDIGVTNDADFSAEQLNSIEPNQTNSVNSSNITTTLTNNQTIGNQPIVNTLGDSNPDEEWKPFDSDENRDYSGLRINQNWKIEDEEENNEDDYADESERKVACPWAMGSKQQAQQTSNSRAEDKKEEINNNNNKNESNETIDKKSEQSETSVTSTTTSQPTVSTTSNTTSAPTAGAYVPPHLRNKTSSDKTSSATTTTTSSSSGSAYIPPHLRNKTDNSTSSSGSSSGGAFVSVTRKSNKVQPNINDTLEFPTLDAASTSETSEKIGTINGDERFDFPKRGARVEAKGHGAMIDLENKFTALSNN